MRYAYFIITIFLAGFSVAQAIAYNPSTIVNVNGVPTPIGRCQSVVGGENGTPQRVINEYCPPSTGPWIHPNAVGPRVTGIPLDATYYADLIKQAALKKANDAKDLAFTRMMERIMQNIGRRSTPSSGRQNTETTQTYNPSSGGTTQVNTISICGGGVFQSQGLCSRVRGCRWDPTRGKGRCVEAE